MILEKHERERSPESADKWPITPGRTHLNFYKGKFKGGFNARIFVPMATEQNSTIQTGLLPSRILMALSITTLVTQSADCFQGWMGEDLGNR